MQIYILTPDGRTLKVDVEPKDSVEPTDSIMKIKQQIGTRSDASVVSTQRVCFADQDGPSCSKVCPCQRLPFAYNKLDDIENNNNKKLRCNIKGYINPGFVGSATASTSALPAASRQSGGQDRRAPPRPVRSTASVRSNASVRSDSSNTLPSDKAANPRDSWGSDKQFLMSCIALSVGLGNVWRFPFTALENGGGAFVIPYLTMLLLIGKPIYYMEMLIGQFSSRSGIKVYDFAPILRGIGYGQALATCIISSFYGTLMAISLRYLFDSFQPTLPWSYCRPEWGDSCIDASESARNALIANSANKSTDNTTSSEFYFSYIILREKDSIDDGIGYPSWSLSLSFAVAWVCIIALAFRGIKSSGKASYFFAISPYFIMFILLIRALTLPGAFKGVLYFLKPQWHKLLEAKVWYAAVTQLFFSLSIGFGNIIMYASYNRFGHNIHRDAFIVTFLDTFTSLLSGIIIFGILGNLAHASGTDDIANVVKGGPSLAFISYPDAIAKFNFVPQLFAVLFFLMLFVLGIGSNTGLVISILTVINDEFVRLKRWHIVVGIAVVSYSVGLMYLTPGGNFMFTLMDFYGVALIVLILAVFEMVALGWIYGVRRFCIDIEFMLGIKTSIYYRICWAIITPLSLMAILIYTFVLYEPLKCNGHAYPLGLYIFGWCLTAFGVSQLFIWAIPAVRRQPAGPLWQRFKNAFKPLPTWGPVDPKTYKSYKSFLKARNVDASKKHRGFCHKIYDNIFK